MKPKQPISPWREFQTQMEAALFGDNDNTAAGQPVKVPPTHPGHPDGAMVTAMSEVDADDALADATSSDSAHRVRLHP